MSQLIIGSISTTFALNVVSFSSPMYEETSSAQTKTMAVHFPIKMAQPSLQLDVVFSSELEYENFQRFIRNHQQQAVANTQLLTLIWPERSINNWTGVCKSFVGGGMRFNPMPHARLEIDLVGSMVSSRTEIASVAMNWRAIYGGIGLPDGVLDEASLTPYQALTQYGEVLADGQFAGISRVANFSSAETQGNPTGLPTATPGLGTNGITVGSGL